MKDREIDEILAHAARAPHEVDSVLLDRVAKSVGSSLRPVRPLPPAWMLEVALAVICVAIALAGAARAGFLGIRNLSDLEHALIFPLLGILIWLAARSSVRELIPGSRRRVTPGILLVAGILLLLAVFAAVFHDYRTDDFVSAGIACLAAGLAVAIPTALASWFVLRRGFAVNSVAAGLAGGTLAGLAGLTMLEFHCPNFEAFHVMVWHVSVVPISAAIGAFLAWAFRSRVNAGA